MNRNVNKGLLDVNVPPVLVFKRQSIRSFPDNTRVATYYNDRIKKTITIPFNTIGISEEKSMVFYRKKKVIEESERKELKQVKNWINGTRMEQELNRYRGKTDSRLSDDLKSLNKEKKELKSSIKSVYRKKNLERTAPKSKKQLSFDFMRKK